MKIYHDLLPDDQRTKVTELQGEITDLERKIAETKPEAQKKTAEQIRAMFDKVLPWFAKAPAEAQAENSAEPGGKAARAQTAANSEQRAAKKSSEKKSGDGKQ
jgi:hypothetical protein